MKKYNSKYKSNYKGNRYRNKNRSYCANHHAHYHKHQTHPEHPVRDAIYATITCLGAVCFAMLWWGVNTGSWLSLFVGITSSVVAFITVNISFFRAFKKIRR